MYTVYERGCQKKVNSQNLLQIAQKTVVIFDNIQNWKQEERKYEREEKVERYVDYKSLLLGPSHSIIIIYEQHNIYTAENSAKTYHT